MIQNKKKLQEVGLEPDKPVGYVRGIWALTLIIAFALVVGSGIYYILWSSPWGESSYWHRHAANDETKDWQTYRHEKYGLSIKYPQRWQYAEFPASQGLDSLISVSFYDQDLSADIERIKANPATEMVYDVVLVMRQGDKKSEYSSEASCEKQSDIKIGGVSGELYKCRNQMIDKDSYDYVVVNNGKTYALAALEENKDTLDKMLKTIDFAAMTVLPSPSNLQNTWNV